MNIWDFPSGSAVKNPPAKQERDAGSIPRFRKIPWRRKWQPTPEFLRGKSHGDYSPWGCKQLNMTLATKKQQQVNIYLNLTFCQLPASPVQILT